MIGFIKRRWYLGLVLILVIFLGIRLLGGNSNAKNNKPYIVKKVDLKNTLSFSGSVDANDKAALTFLSPGKIAFIHVKNGDIVKKGEAIAGLDMGDLDQAVSAAWYKYLAADANAKQIEDSVKNNDSTESFTQKNTRVAAQTDRDIKYDSWLAALRARRNGILYSPINGVVANVPNLEPGVLLANPVSAEYDIVNPESIYFSALADQTEVTKLMAGAKADIVLDAYPDKPVVGTVGQIAFTPKQGETGTVYEVQLLMATSNSDYQIRLGMTGDVNFLIGEKKGVIAVPSRYVKTESKGKYVVKFRGTGAVKTMVTVGETLEGQTEILTGLTEGETIYDQTL